MHNWGERMSPSERTWTGPSAPERLNLLRAATSIAIVGASDKPLHGDEPGAQGGGWLSLYLRVTGTWGAGRPTPRPALPLTRTPRDLGLTTATSTSQDHDTSTPARRGQSGEGSWREDTGQPRPRPKERIYV